MVRLTRRPRVIRQRTLPLFAAVVARKRARGVGVSLPPDHHEHSLG
jgi:hypothetical protein